MHLVDKHMFPKDYDFYIVNDGIDQRSSMLRSGRHRRKSSAAQHARSVGALPYTAAYDSLAAGTKAQSISKQPSVVLETTQGVQSSTPSSPKEGGEMDELAGAMSSLKFVPPSVRFGRGRGRGFSKT